MVILGFEGVVDPSENVLKDLVVDGFAEGVQIGLASLLTVGRIDSLLQKSLPLI